MISSNFNEHRSRWMNIQTIQASFHQYNVFLPSVHLGGHHQSTHIYRWFSIQAARSWANVTIMPVLSIIGNKSLKLHTSNESSLQAVTTHSHPFSLFIQKSRYIPARPNQLHHHQWWWFQLDKLSWSEGPIHERAHWIGNIICLDTRINNK